jgi:PAS domain S-box-containing protein
VRKKPGILIVEDQNIIAFEIKNSLIDAGYSVLGVANSGEDAIIKSENILPDLVLMDIRLEGEIDGIQAAKIIYERFNIPVIYLSAYADDRTIEKAINSKPYGFLCKPFIDNELHATIQTVLYRHNFENSLKIKKQYFTYILKSLSEAVITTDNTGRIIYINYITEMLTGWKQTDIIGKLLFNILKIENLNNKQSLRNLVEEILHKGQAFKLKDINIFLKENREKITINFNITPIKDNDRKIIGIIFKFWVVSDHEWIEKKEEIMNLLLDSIKIQDTLFKVENKSDKFLHVKDNKVLENIQ